jgi:hypothetical protein
VARLDSSDAPSVSVALTVSDVNAAVINNQTIHFLTNNGSTLYHLYSDTITFDLWRDTSTDGGTTWGTNVENGMPLP